MKLKIWVAGLGLALAALAAESGMELYQKAVTQERAGKMDEAIRLYEKVAHDFASDRALAAKALVAAARDFEKLGQDKQDEAVKLYEQVTREYGDQREFAETARVKLAALRQPAPPLPQTMTQRKIETPPGFLPYVGYTDGQRTVYRDATTGATVISDLAGKNKRVVYNPKPGEVVAAVPSRDLSMIGLFRRTPGDPGETIAVMKTDGTGYREIARMEVRSLSAPTWSWDNRYILENPRAADGTTSLVVISVADGQAREVLRRESRDIGRASFSPNGNFIAYSEGRYATAVFVVPSQSGQPQLVADNATLLDWTRDGRYLAVSRPRAGVTALELFPVAEGKAAGEPVFIRYGAFEFGNTTASGALLYMTIPPTGGFPAWIADLDSDGHPGDWKSFSFGPDPTHWPVPTWSPDSSQIAWTLRNRDTGQAEYLVRIRNLATGVERDLYRTAGFLECTSAARGPKIFCTEAQSGGTTNILAIPVDSGRVEGLGSVQGEAMVLSVSTPNDETLYLGRFDGRLNLTRWDIGTHQETLLEDRWISGDFDSPEPSWDGGWLVRKANGNLEVRPMPGGTWRPLLPLRAQSQTGFSPDGKWIFYHNVDAAGKDGLYRVATAGGSPERLGDFPSGNLGGRLTVSPDGRKMIAQAKPPNIVPETWLLENYVPKAPAGR